MALAKTIKRKMVRILSQPFGGRAASVIRALISWSFASGGGTTDYAVGIYHKTSKIIGTNVLSAETKMPMMYMDDAIAATIQIMQAPAEQIKIRSSYNLTR